VAARRRPDLLHIHAIGPSLMVPLARLLGLRIVVTHHGFDYQREKWTGVAKLVLRLAEYCGMHFAHARIAVSRAIADSVERRFSVSCCTIHNGIEVPEAVQGVGALERFDIRPLHYVLNVGRLVPEKCHLDLITAFAQADLKGWQLILVGSADHESAYSKAVRKAAGDYANVIMTGALTGRELAEIYAHAGIFVLPSSHEGMPIVLLEALSHGLPTLASEIPANMEMCMFVDRYFPLHNVDALSDQLRQLVRNPNPASGRAFIAKAVVHRFAWREIAQQTLQSYLDCLPPSETKFRGENATCAPSDRDPSLVGNLSPSVNQYHVTRNLDVLE
jgi:glycosyltransferase involved in cell wall biosynthesis